MGPRGVLVVRRVYNLIFDGVEMMLYNLELLLLPNETYMSC